MEINDEKSKSSDGSQCSDIERGLVLQSYKSEIGDTVTDLSMNDSKFAQLSTLEHLAAAAFQAQENSRDKEQAILHNDSQQLGGEQHDNVSNLEKKRYLNRCLFCHKDVVWLKRHLKGAHSLNEVQAAHISRDMCRKPSKSKDARPLKTCSICGFKVQRLDQHFKKIHKMDCTSQEYRRCLLQSRKASGCNNVFLYGIEDNGEILKRDWFVTDIRKEFEALYKNKLLSHQEDEEIINEGSCHEISTPNPCDSMKLRTLKDSESDDPKFHLQWPDQKDFLMKSIQESFNIEAFTDLIIYCGQTAIPCHRFVLSSASNLLKKLLEDPSIDAIYLPETRFSAVQAIITFVYTGRIAISVELLGEFMEISKSLDMTFRISESEDDCHNNESPGVNKDKSERVIDVQLNQMTRRDVGEKTREKFNFSNQSFRGYVRNSGDESLDLEETSDDSNHSIEYSDEDNYSSDRTDQKVSDKSYQDVKKNKDLDQTPTSEAVLNEQVLIPTTDVQLFGGGSKSGPTTIDSQLENSKAGTVQLDTISNASLVTEPKCKTPPDPGLKCKTPPDPEPKDKTISDLKLESKTSPDSEPKSLTPSDPYPKSKTSPEPISKTSADPEPTSKTSPVQEPKSKTPPSSDTKSKTFPNMDTRFKTSSGRRSKISGYPQTNFDTYPDPETRSETHKDTRPTTIQDSVSTVKINYNARTKTNAIHNPGTRGNASEDSFTLVKNLQDSDTRVKNRQDPGTGVKNLQDSDTRVKNLQDSDTRVKNLQDSDTRVKNLQDSDTRVKNRQDSDTGVKNLQDSDTRVKNLQDSDTRVKNLQASDTRSKTSVFNNGNIYDLSCARDATIDNSGCRTSDSSSQVDDLNVSSGGTTDISTVPKPIICLGSSASRSRNDSGYPIVAKEMRIPEDFTGVDGKWHITKSRDWNVKFIPNGPKSTSTPSCPSGAPVVHSRAAKEFESIPEKSLNMSTSTSIRKRNKRNQEDVIKPKRNLREVKAIACPYCEQVLSSPVMLSIHACRAKRNSSILD